MFKADVKMNIAEVVALGVQEILPYLEDTSIRAPKSIHYEGHFRLGASAVLRAIAEHPPPSLREKFDKIIHIDCSRWKSRRELQREIADKLKLTRQVAADFDKQDEEDDFRGVDQGYRAEISSVAQVIAQSLARYKCLVVFHNGSDDIVDLANYGIMLHHLFHNKLLWNFRGPRYENTWSKVREQNLCLPGSSSLIEPNALLAEEAKELTLYAHKLGIKVTPKVAKDCCLYLLTLNDQGGDVINYNDWATHASNYWVCDGIVQGGHDNQAWEIARTLQQQIRLEDYSSKAVPRSFVHALDIPAKRWVSSHSEEVPSRATSLFFAPRHESAYLSFPRERFHEADQLRVLKLCRCTFSFSSPPFHCCRNLRFLGLDKCVDEQLGEEEEKTAGARAVETFKRLWVLDVSHTDWELDFPLETEEPTVATDIREVHVNRGRVWRSHFAWRRLPNLHRLRVVEPTSPWETAGREDEFMDMVKLELLDLSGESTIQVLPSLSGATNLKTLALRGCLELGHVGPQGLPPSLESFCFTGVGYYNPNEVKISRINLAGCARLADCTLGASLPNLVELDLSQTAVKTLNLRAHMPRLQTILLMGCEQLRFIYWRYYVKRSALRLLCIDTRAGGEVCKKASSCDSLMGHQGKGEDKFNAFVAAADMRFLQSVVSPLSHWKNAANVKVSICLSSSRKDDGSAGRVAGGGSPPLARSLIYHDLQKIATQIDSSSGVTVPFQPLDIHMEIGEGVRDVPNMERPTEAILSAMNMVKSLHVHDNSSLTNVTPEKILTDTRNASVVMDQLKWCRVERCPSLQTVFTTSYAGINFRWLETFWAAHLLMASSIWRCSAVKRVRLRWDGRSFEALRAIQIHFCPRLRYVRTLSGNDDLFNHLETLHILSCGDLRHVFPVEQEILEKIVTSHEAQAMLAFPKLKDMYLHHLSSLELICEAKMFAPKLETVYIRGCWGLKRLPATDSRRCQEGRPVAVDCEKDWWDKLEWDGMESGHHPSLSEPHHSKYYRKRHLRSTVLR